MPKVKEAVAVISEVAVKGSVWRSLAFYLLKLWRSLAFYLLKLSLMN